MSEMVHHGMSGHPSDEYYGCCLCTIPKIEKLTAERDALRAENEQHINKVRVEIVRRTNAETERDRYREALEAITDDRTLGISNMAKEIARAALGETK